MQKTVRAKYVKGVFEPVEPVVGLEENRQVTVIIEVPDRRPPLEGWIGGLSVDQILQDTLYDPALLSQRA